jgi:acetylornithine deacetylase/succinyl-diaminopimelate desuccinylase-like protein
MPEPSDQSRAHRRQRIVAVALLAILAAGAAGIVVWNRRLASQIAKDQRYIPRKVTMSPEIALLQEYVRIDTSTPEGAATGARWLAAALEARGVKAELIESAPGRLNVYARIKGRREGDGLVLFNHIDVVAPGDTWRNPPFAGIIAGDELFGRGTLDMKALAVCQLYAFAEAARAPKPERDLVFLATADEETGSHFGMRWIVANRPDVLAGIRFGITEGGLTEMTGDEMVYFGIETGGKQMVDVDLVAGNPERLRAARLALEPYIFPREPHRVIPEVARYFKAVAPTRLAYRRTLDDIDDAITRGKFWDLPAPYRDLAQNSLFIQAPRRDGERWILNVKMLNLPDENPEDRIRWLQESVKSHGVTLGTVHEKEGPVALSPIDTPLFELLARQAKDVYRVPSGPIILYRSRTDARFLRPLGIICYGVSPFPVTFFQTLGIHGKNERIGLPGFQEGVDYTRSIVRQWAAEK